MRVLAGLILALGVLSVRTAYAQVAVDTPPANTPMVAAPADPAAPPATDPAAPIPVVAPVPAPITAPPPIPVVAPAPKPVVARFEPPAEDTPPLLDDAAFDAAFQCPETLSSAESRMSEIALYFAWARLRHPDWSFRKKLDVRYGLLRRHACTTTLASIASSARPPFGR